MKPRFGSLDYYKLIIPKGVTVQYSTEEPGVIKFTIKSQELNKNCTVDKIKTYLRKHKALEICFVYEVI